jgi:hypothetical protein
MAYPLTCAGKYPMPIKPGKNKIVKIIAAISDRTANSRLILIDDHTINPVDKQGTVRSLKTTDHTQLVDLKGVGGQGAGYLEADFPGGLKLRDGVTVVDTTNLQSGGICIYVE